MRATWGYSLHILQKLRCMQKKTPSGEIPRLSVLRYIPNVTSLESCKGSQERGWHWTTHPMLFRTQEMGRILPKQARQQTHLQQLCRNRFIFGSEMVHGRQGTHRIHHQGANEKTSHTYHLKAAIESLTVSLEEAENGVININKIYCSQRAKLRDYFYRDSE